MEKRCHVVFYNNECIIYGKGNHNQIIAKVNMLPNGIFALEFPCASNKALKVGHDNDSWL